MNRVRSGTVSPTRIIHRADRRVLQAGRGDAPSWRGISGGSKCRPTSPSSSPSSRVARRRRPEARACLSWPLPSRAPTSFPSRRRPSSRLSSGSAIPKRGEGAHHRPSLPIAARATRRRYDRRTEAAGRSVRRTGRWSQTVGTLLWTHAQIVVTHFLGATSWICTSPAGSTSTLRRRSNSPGWRAATSP